MISLSSAAVDATAPASIPAARPFASPLTRLLHPRIVAVFLALVAVIPVAAMLLYAHSLNRNIPYFDEIDSAIALLLRLDAGIGLSDFVAQMLAVTNEHRTVTSRLLFAASYALTGTVNFLWIGIIGNAFILLACALLLLATKGLLPRLRLGVLLSLLLFHLGNYESFFWSGSSIDHFQIVAFAVGACVALQHAARLTLHLALLAAVLATFTLAHGLVLWPVGAAFLALDRRWRDLALWCAIAAASAGIFFAGFEVNPGHRIGTSGWVAVEIVGLYWLKVLGAPLAFGHPLVAVGLGIVMVVATAFRTFGRPWSHERGTLPLLWFAIGSAFLIAVGRAELSGGEIASRYLILGGFGWALLLWGWIEQLSPPQHPYRAIAAALPLLLAFNLAQTTRYHADALTFVEHRDRAALRFRQFGEDGRVPTASLHPLPQHSTRVLASAEQRGLFRMPVLCERREFPDADSSDRIAYHLDEFTLNEKSAYFAGWAGIPGRRIRRGEVHLVLQTATARHVFTTVPIRRPDVVRVLAQPEFEHSGFRATLRRSRLDPALYQVGFLISDGDDAEFILTSHQLDLTGPGRITFVP